MPPRTFMSVLLPAPFCPTSARTSDGASPRLTSSRTFVEPNVCEIPRISTLGARAVATSPDGASVTACSLHSTRLPQPPAPCRAGGASSGLPVPGGLVLVDVLLGDVRQFKHERRTLDGVLVALE